MRKPTRSRRNLWSKTYQQTNPLEEAQCQEHEVQERELEDTVEDEVEKDTAEDEVGETRPLMDQGCDEQNSCASCDA